MFVRCGSRKSIFYRHLFDWTFRTRLLVLLLPCFVSYKRAIEQCMRWSLNKLFWIKHEELPFYFMRYIMTNFLKISHLNDKNNWVNQSLDSCGFYLKNISNMEKFKFSVRISQVIVWIIWSYSIDLSDNRIVIFVLCVLIIMFRFYS